MEEQIQQNPVPEKPKRRFWKFIVGFLAIIIIVGGGFFVWEKYFSPAAKLERQTRENYQKYLDWQKNYENAMKNDTYGGKTPEETLQMFIDALKKEDIELASKYFAFETGGPDAFNRKKWEDALKMAQKDQKLQEIISKIEKTEPVGYADSYTWYKKSFSFESLNEDGTVEVLIELVFNHLSGVWKIESL